MPTYLHICIYTYTGTDPHVSEVLDFLREIMEHPVLQLFITDVVNPPEKSGSAAATTWKRTTALPVMPQIHW